MPVPLAMFTVRLAIVLWQCQASDLVRLPGRWRTEYNMRCVSVKTAGASELPGEVLRKPHA